MKMTVISAGSSQAALEVVFDRRKNESLTADFALIVSRSGNLTLAREGKQSWLGGGMAAAAALAQKKEGEGVRERIYAQAEQGGSVILAPEYPGDVVIFSMQEAIPVLRPSTSAAAYLPTALSTPSAGFNVMAGTHILAREGSITSHTIRDPHLTKTLGLVGLRHYRGAGKLALASYGNILRRDLCRGEECLVKKGHLLAWSAGIKISRPAGRKALAGSNNEAKGFVLQGPGTFYVRSHSVSDLQAWLSHPAGQRQNPSMMHAQIAAEGGVLDRGDLVIKYLGWTVATISGLLIATSMATVFQEGPAGLRRLPGRFRQMGKDTAAGVQDAAHQARVHLQHQGEMAVDKTIVMWARVRHAVVSLLRELLKRCQGCLQSLSGKGKELQVLLEEMFDKLMQAWHRLEDEASAAMKSPNNSPAPLPLPPPQSEQVQEEEHIPLVALSEATILQAADEGSTILFSESPSPEPVIDALPLEELNEEIPVLKDTPILTPPSLLSPTEELLIEDTVEEIETHADISLPAALSSVMPTERDALKIVDKISLDSLDESAVPLPPPSAAEATRRPRSMKNDKALVFNADSPDIPQQHISSHSHSQGGKSDRENGPIASAPADKAAVNTEEEP